MKKEHLISAGIDYENAVSRFAGNEALYEKYLNKLKDDNHYQNAVTALAEGDYATVLKEVHTLKGIVGTLGMTDLFQICAEIVSFLRAEDTSKLTEQFACLQKEYSRMINLVSENE